MSGTTMPVVLQVPRTGRVGAVRYFARRNPRMIVGGAMVVTWLLVSLFAPWVAPYGPKDVDVSHSLLGPSLTHLMGTDDLGRDVLSRVIWGSRISLSVGLISVGIGFFVGVSIGLAAGYLGGKFDLFIMRGIDALLAFPALVLAIAITAALGPQIQNAMIAIGIVAIPAYARLTRGQTLAIRSRDFVLAARTVGCSPFRIVMRHIFPNVTNSLIVQATLSTAFAILAEAALSFLGLGPQPPDPSWG
jgi:peptide/nickel transport system permease protein